MDEAIRALDVLLLHDDTIHVGITWLAVALEIEQEVHVIVGNELVVQEHLNEVNHWRCRSVHHHWDGLVLVAIVLPVWSLRHSRWCHERNGVVLRLTGQSTHTVTLCRTFRTGQVSNLTGVVNHASIEKQFLLGKSKPFVTAHAPLVLLEEASISIVISHEQSLATRLRKDRSITQVVDESHRVGIVAIALQVVVDA